MKSSAHYFIYLAHVLERPQYSHLKRFLHPGSLAAGELIVLATNLDLGFHPYLSAQVKDWANGGSRHVLLRHEIVVSILEVASHTSQFGFVDLSELPDKQTDQDS